MVPHREACEAVEIMASLASLEPLGGACGSSARLSVVLLVLVGWVGEHRVWFLAMLVPVYPAPVGSRSLSKKTRGRSDSLILRQKGSAQLCSIAAKSFLPHLGGVAILLKGVSGMRGSAHWGGGMAWREAGRGNGHTRICCASCSN